MRGREGGKKEGGKKREGGRKGEGREDREGRGREGETDEHAAEISAHNQKEPDRRKENERRGVS